MESSKNESIQFFQELIDSFEKYEDGQFLMELLNALSNDLIRYQLKNGLRYRLVGNDFANNIIEYSKVNAEWRKGVNCMQELPLKLVDNNPSSQAIIYTQLLFKYYTLVFDDRIQAYLNEMEDRSSYGL